MLLDAAKQADLLERGRRLNKVRPLPQPDIAANGPGSQSEPVSEPEAVSVPPEPEWAPIPPVGQKKDRPRGESEAVSRMGGFWDLGNAHNHPSTSASQVAEEPEWVKPPREAGLRLVKPQKDLLEQVPPHDALNEMNVLGALFLHPERISEVNLVPLDFYRPSHAAVFGAMKACQREGRAIDPGTIEYELKKRGEFESVGGMAYLAELAATVPSAWNLQSYVDIVRETAIKRRLTSRAQALIELAMNGASAVAVLEEAKNLTLVGELPDKSLPQLITRDIEIISARELWQRQSSRPARSWVIDGWLARKEISLWSGKVEHGKTTAIRTLVMCALRGEYFLERATFPTRVLYVMLDADGEELTYEEFQTLGLNWDIDAIDFLIDPVMCLRPNSFEQFYQKLLDLKPGLVVIDPLGRFERIDSADGGFNGYGMTYAMARFSELAKRADCHILLNHHIPRGRSETDDAATAGFGSIAIAGGCNARFVLRKKSGDLYTMLTSKGKGGGFRPFDGEQVLDMDPDTHWVSLRGPYSFKDQAKACKPIVKELVENSDREWTADAIARELKLQRSVAGLAAKMIHHDDGEIAMKGDGKRHLFASWGYAHANKWS